MLVLCYNWKIWPGTVPLVVGVWIVCRTTQLFMVHCYQKWANYGVLMQYWENVIGGLRGANMYVHKLKLHCLVLTITIFYLMNKPYWKEMVAINFAQFYWSIKMNPSYNVYKITGTWRMWKTNKQTNKQTNV